MSTPQDPRHQAAAAFHRRAFEIFAGALRISAADRESWLDVVCANDPDLRAEVVSLLAHDRVDEPTRVDARDVLLGVVAEGGPPGSGAADADAGLRPGDVVDRYKLLEEIGEGGMGTVWMADQLEPVRRRVALKVIKLGMDTREVVRRFEAERQALALMDHPNIAKVHDGGTTATGRPYFVMELVKGTPITEYCDQARLNVRERLALFTQVCEALQHAHHKGVIHRDVKPSNVLVTLFDGVPVPKVIDFGIAKATDAELTTKTLFTRFEQVVGTPEYMAPEQAERSGLDIDTRADVYSLGVLLYELLTGTTPFSSAAALRHGYDELLRTIREDDPERPSTRVSTLGETATHVAQSRQADTHRLSRSLRGDLDWIVMKALEKDRRRRYETAHGLAADVRRHLADEPVQAGPPSATYRMRKFVRRHRAQVVTAGVLAVALVLGVIGTSVGMLGALREAERAERELARASEIKRLVTGMLVSVRPEVARTADVALLKGILDDTAARLRSGEVADELVAAELHNVIGVAYGSLGLYEAAERHLPLALEVRTRLLGEEHPATLGSRNDLAALLGEQGRPAEAESLFVRTLEARRRVLGAEHVDTLRSMSNLATAYLSQGRNAEAERLFEETLALRRRVSGPEHPDTLVVEGNLAEVYESQGRLDEAASLQARTLDVMRRVLGEDHPSTLLSTDNLAVVLRQLGRHAEATPLQEQALDVRRRVLGEEHPDTLQSTINLADLYGERGLTAEVEPLLVRALEVQRRALREEHPLTLRAMGDLATLYAQQGRYAEAEPLFVRALELRRRLQGDEHPRTLAAMSDLAALLTLQGRHAEAEAHLAPALEGQRRVQGDAHPGTLLTMLNLTAALNAQGRYAESERHLLEALELSRGALGHEHPTTLLVMNNLAVLCAEVERDDEALAWNRATLDASRRALGEEHPDTLRAMNNLAAAYRALGRDDEAEPLLVQALEGRRRVLGGAHPATLRSLDNLLALYRDQGREADAAPLLREALERRVVAAEGDDADPLTMNDAAWELLTHELEALRDPPRALALARRACAAAEAQGSPQLWNLLDTLALAQSRVGDAAGALASERRAMALVPPDDPARPDVERALAGYEAAVRAGGER